ncbi:hypothetical protein RSAG8_12529, partial [Rhizoctonia solani AG-8 WAC10335]
MAPTRITPDGSQVSDIKISPSYSASSQSPLLQHVLEHGVDARLASLAIADTSRKRPSPMPAPVVPFKRAKLTIPSNAGSSTGSLSNGVAPASPSLPPPSAIGSPNIQELPPSQQLPPLTTPVHTRMNSVASNFSATSSTSSTRQARARPGTSVWNQAYPNKHIHLRQLQDIVSRIPNLSTSSGEHTVDELLLDPDHTLFLHVFVACLMHAFYRPADPNRTIWLLMDRTQDPSLWRPKPGLDQPPPTHILGLINLTEDEFTILIWGTCELVDDNQLDIRLTFYDSQAKLRSKELMRPFLETVSEIIRFSIPEEYEIIQQPTVQSAWTEDFLDMSQQQLSMVFCQMISTVVHELPFDRQALKQAPPVRPVWPVDSVEAQIRALLGQVADGRLRVQDLMTAESGVPECICLHGDPLESEGLVVPDPPLEMDDPQSIPLDDLLTRTEAWVNQRASLESMGHADWYVRVSNDVRYQTATPSNLSVMGTPAPRAGTSPARELASNDANMDQQNLIESTHALMLSHHGYEHPARVAYWHQLKQSSPGIECISLITTHLWLSSLLASPSQSVFYIDPQLATELIQCDDEDLLELDKNLLGLFDRQKLWEHMGSTLNILALIHLQDLYEPNPGELSWVLMDMKVEHARVTSMNVVLSPCTTYNKNRFAWLASRLIGAIRCILPGRSLVAHSSKPFTQESVVLVMMAYLLGKMLCQVVDSVDIHMMCQAICFYYDHALRSRDVDLSFPWRGLTDMDGNLLTQEILDEVRKKRFMLASNREPSPFEMFPRHRSFAATLATPGPSEPFFLELSQTHSSHSEGILMGTSGRIGLMWRNIPRESEMEDWYHTFLTSLRIIRSQLPYQWQHAVERTIEALPTSYKMASTQANCGGGTRTFVSHRIEPVILNLVFKIMREIINITPQLAKYRDYFFHLCGINLKLATMNIHGREDENPINYAFRTYGFIDWYAQNPHDIIADVGLTANAHRPSMPDELRRSTLLFRFGPMRELLRPAYQMPHQDRYCLSHVISGGRAVPRATVRSKAAVAKVQFYKKDMVLTHRHRDKSIGANFTVAESLQMGNREKFPSEMKAFQDVMAGADTYGVRLEIRLSAWGANRYMKMDPRDILDRLLSANSIICYSTRTVVDFKVTLNKGWSAIIQRQCQLPLVSRKTPEVVLLTSVLAYWLKSLVKRPDEMSATREMVEDLQLTEMAERHGLPFLRSNALDLNGPRISYVVNAETFKILSFSNVITPGGNRIKGSKAIRVIAPPPNALQSPPSSPPRAQEPVTLWPQTSEDFLKALVNVYLPQALWSQFPKNRLRLGNQSNALRKKPLKLRLWSEIVDHLNPTKVIQGKFMEKSWHLIGCFPPIGPPLRMEVN